MILGNEMGARRGWRRTRRRVVGRGAVQVQPVCSKSAGDPVGAKYARSDPT